MLEEISLFFLSLSLALAVNTLNESSTCLPEEPSRPVDDLLLQCVLEHAELCLPGDQADAGLQDGGQTNAALLHLREDKPGLF